MANIKFSAFTQKVVDTDVDFLVGYTGADNVRISPSTIGQGVYLPLAGGTMTGNLDFGDGIVAQFGAGQDLRIQHNGTDNFIDSIKGNLSIRNFDNDKDIIFQTDNGSGGIATYFFLDGSATQTTFQLDTRHNDNVKAKFGSAGDLQIYHNGVNSVIESDTGNLALINTADNKDIIFQSDDGSGGTATYFRVEGSAVETRFLKSTLHYDNVKAKFGDGSDLQIYHNGSTNNSNIENSTGSLYLTNYANDEDIIFRSDDGSGGVTEYFRVDGGVVRTIFTRNTAHVDNAKAIFGSGDDLQIYHNGSNSFISDTGTGLLVISSNHLQVYNAGISEFMITAEENGAVNLYYDGSKKFETTTTGIAIPSGQSVDFINSNLGYNAIKRNSTVGGLEIKTGGTASINILDNGNVGIGTASPLADLTVATPMSSSRTSILYLDIDGTNTDGGGGEIVFSTSASSGDLTNYNAKVTGTRVSGDGGDSELGFWTTLVSDNVASQQRMVITKEGNVGIGTTSPASKLEVDGGDVEVSDSLNGLILKSPDGTRYRVTVANGGTLTVSAA